MKEGIFIFKKVISLILTFILLSSVVLSVSATVPEYDLEIISVSQETTSKFGYSDFVFTDKNGEKYKFVSGDSLNQYRPNALSNSVTLPVSYNAQEYGYVTSVKNQGCSGSCWSFSTMSALESDSIIQGISDNNIDCSEAHHVWFNERLKTTYISDSTYGDGYLADNPYLTGGNWITAIRSLAKWSGVANDNDFAFTPFDLSQMGNYAETERYNKNSGIVLKSAECLLDTNDVKQWIMQHGSTTATLYFDESYLYNKEAYYYNGTEGLNHQIVIVGWDDAYSFSNFNPANKPSASGAWLCKNSWGEEFGNNGYFWVSYCDKVLGNFVGFTSQSADKYRTNYTYNGAGWGAILANKGSASIANVFKTKENEILSAISTYLIVADEKINISIYTDLPTNYSLPTQGSLAIKFSTTIERAGYHTLDLPSEISLKPNSYFSVVIEFVNPNSTSYVPVEVNGQSEMTFSSCQGQSFAYLPQYNSSWNKTENFGLNNVCIQAFTKCNHQVETVKITPPTCTNDGSEQLICSQCNAVLGNNIVYAGGHNFGEWSEYSYELDGYKTKTRECLSCGYIEKINEKTSRNGYRVVTLDEFFEILAEWIEDFIRRICEGLKTL